MHRVAIIDQCTGRKVKKVIVKRRVDFVAGHINSYTCMLNGQKDIEKIKTYNQLASSIAELRKEQDAI